MGYTSNNKTLIESSKIVKFPKRAGDGVNPVKWQYLNGLMSGR